MTRDRKPTGDNATMLQGFEWNVPADQKHWIRLHSAIPGLKAIGIDNLWIPPACKGSSPNGNGYDIYDLYDLGEFDQKGARSTKWGPREDLMKLAEKAKAVGVGIYFDAVLNHKAGADSKEKVQAVECDSNDRMKDLTAPYEIEAWVGFDFPGRGDKYSSQKYHWEHFSGTDYNAANHKSAIYRFVGDNKHWSDSVDKEHGNADYMMFADIDYANAEVQSDVKAWGQWVVTELGLKGFRFDAAQHYSQDFLNDFVSMIEAKFGNYSLFLVGEFWNGDTKTLLDYLQKMKHRFSLFDAPLLYSFARTSKTEDADLRKVFDNTLVEVEPYNAVTLIMNHDTQAGQTMETSIEGFFKPLAYALILLRAEGYPQLFYGDLFGIKGEHAEGPSCGGKLPDLTLARHLYAYGEQQDHFDEQNCIGWVRMGTWDRKDGLACVMSNAGPGQREMYVGKLHAGEVWTDVLRWETSEVKIDNGGNGLFPCPGTSVAVWVNKEAKGRDRFGKFDANIYK